MPLPIQQLKGNLKMGPVTASQDVSGSVTGMTIKRARASIAIAATLLTGEAGEAAGALSAQLVIDFNSSLAATSLWAMLYDALDTDTSELKFEGTLDAGVVGPDNPKWSGTVIILSIDTGGQVGALRQQQQTFSIKPGTLQKAVA